MGKLQLQDSVLHLDIDGNLFDVALTPQFIRALQDIGQNAASVPLTGGAEDVSAVGDWMSNSLDQLLGEGAAQKIWGDQPNLIAFVPIIKYIMDESAEVMNAQNAQFQRPRANAVPMPMNRAQRRAIKPPQTAKPEDEIAAAKAVLAKAGYEFTD